MSEKTPQIPKIVAEKGENFQQIFVDGVYTWLGQESGVISFFIDELDPVIDDNGALQAKTIKRKFLVEVRMSPNTYDKIIQWMIERKRVLESQLQKEDPSK